MAAVFFYTSDTLVIEGGATLNNSTFDSGNAGDINLIATDLLDIQRWF